MHRILSSSARAFAVLFLCLPAAGQTPIETRSSQTPSAAGDDPRIILELGAATSWNTTGGAATFAPNFAAEITPIENWLELEAGISPFVTGNTVEWDTDLLVKKPWTLSEKAEFMLGLGPQWVCLRQSGKTMNSAAGEVAADFMFWPTGRHRFGWFFEPSYDISFAASHQQSIGMSAGLLIGVRRRHQ